MRSFFFQDHNTFDLLIQNVQNAYKHIPLKRKERNEEEGGREAEKREEAMRRKRERMGTEKERKKNKLSIKVGGVLISPQKPSRPTRGSKGEKGRGKE